MQEWKKFIVGTALNPVIDQMNTEKQAITSLDEDWDMETYEDSKES